MGITIKGLNHKIKSAGKNSSISSIAWLFGDKIVRLGLGVVIVALIARYLGPSSFGLLSSVYSFVWIFETVVTVGLNEILIRDLIQNPEKRDEIMGSALVLKILGCLATLLLVTGFLLFLKPQETSTLHIALIICISLFLKNGGVIRSWFESQILSKYLVISEIIAFLITAGIRLFFISQHYSLIMFVWAYVIEAIPSTILFIYFYQQKGGKINHWRFNVNQLKKLFRDSWVVIFSGLSIMIYFRCDQILVKFLAGDKEAGIYNVAARLSEMWYFFPSSIIVTLFPKALSHKIDYFKQYESDVQQLYFIVSLISIVVAIIMTILSSFLVTLIFGKEYIVAAQVLTIHIWGGVFLLLFIASSKQLVAEGLQRLDLFRTAIGALLNISINIILIPRMGATGSAIATVISYAVSLFSLSIFLKGRRMSGMLLNAFNPLYLARFASNTLKQSTVKILSRHITE